MRNRSLSLLTSLRRGARRLRASRGDSPRNIRFGFLVGIAKSGTNWAGSLLNLHPRIHCDGEFHFEYFFEAFQRFRDGTWLVGNRPMVGATARSALDQLIRDVMAAVGKAHPSAEWIIDRTPRAFTVLLEGSPQIYIMRDGRDMLVSFTFHQLRTSPPDRFPPHTREWYTRHWEAFQRDPACVSLQSPGLLAEEEWVRYHARRWATQLRDDLSAIEKARTAVLPTPVLSLRYEDLHADPGLWRTRMYQHLGLDPSEAAPLSPESMTTPGFKKEDRTSFYRKGQVGDWKNYAIEDFRRWFKEEAGEVLIELGYEQSLNW